MTQDFRQFGPESVRAGAGQGDRATPRLAQPVRAGLQPPQRIVIGSLYASAVVFFLAGLWLMLGEQTFFPAESGAMVGMSFLLVAVFDLVAVRFLKAVWARQAK